jgi:hypothetical protein
MIIQLTALDDPLVFSASIAKVLIPGNIGRAS